jgi:hypothetical protein
MDQQLAKGTSSGMQPQAAHRQPSRQAAQQ